MSEEGLDAGLEARVRSYYRTVGRYIDRESVGTEERRFWRGMARDATPSWTLELGCGTGRITEVLARAGAPVVGVDLSPAMLRRARRRLGRRPAGARRPEERGPVHLLRADIRRLPLRRRFGLAAAARDPFAHLIHGADRDRALAEAARLLAPGGALAAELHWLPPERLERARRPEGLRQLRRLGSAGEELRVRETWHCDGETRRCVARYEYLRGERVVDRASFRARLWSPDELERRLEGAGLRLRSRWGSFAREPFEPEASSRLVVVATPAASAIPKDRRST